VAISPALINLGLRADGVVLTWGRNLEGQLALPEGSTNLSLPVIVSGSVNTSVPGTYQLTYSTTNSLGAVATTTRTVVVRHPRRLRPRRNPPPA